ncbi:MAG: hypothetical protein H6599_05430 [Flavobacteriales bacterium]|nr:hypothetical protein [Flavobacteriales bacterium]
MADLLQEYKEYYRTRADRFKNDPEYSFSYEAENNLAKAMESCSLLEEFKDKLGNLNDLCAVALVKDDMRVEYSTFDEMKEDIRKLAAQRILAQVDGCVDVMDVVTLVTEITNHNSIEISKDEMAIDVFSDWKRLEDIEELETAIVPERRKGENRESSQAIKNKMMENIIDLENSLKEWFPGWKLELDLIYEERHFRLLPYPKESIDRRFNEMRAVTNR